LFLTSSFFIVFFPRLSSLLRNSHRGFPSGPDESTRLFFFFLELFEVFFDRRRLSLLQLQDFFLAWKGDPFYGPKFFPSQTFQLFFLKLVGSATISIFLNPFFFLWFSHAFLIRLLRLSFIRKFCGSIGCESRFLVPEVTLFTLIFLPNFPLWESGTSRPALVPLVFMCRVFFLLLAHAIFHRTAFVRPGFLFWSSRLTA